MYPDQSLYPANSVPHVVRRINQALQRADQIHHSEGDDSIDWFAPIVADAEAGFGGPLNVFELMKAMIEAGAAGVHFEDQLASEKKCGHMGGKVLLPTPNSVRNLDRRAAGRRRHGRAHRAGGPHRRGGGQPDHQRRRPARPPSSSPASARPRASSGCATGSSRPSPAAWPTPPTPTWSGARPRSPTSTRPAPSPRRSTTRYPGKLLAYNCSPSFNWKLKLDDGHHRELPARARRRWATSSSSSRWPASTRSTTACSSWPAATASAAWRAYADLQELEFASRGPRLHRHPPPARGRHRLLRRRGPGGIRRHVVDHRPHRLHRAGPVPLA